MQIPPLEEVRLRPSSEPRAMQGKWTRVCAQFFNEVVGFPVS